MSTRETILAAFKTTLDALVPSPITGGVYRSRLEQLPALPAVIVSPDGEEAEEQLLGVMDAELQVNVAIYVKGDAPDSTADTLLAAVHAAISADLSLGLGSDVQILPRRRVTWDFDQYDEARILVRYSVFYRTTFGGM